MRRLLRSFALRTALAVAGAALLLSLLGSGWGWWQAEQALRQQLDLVLAAEAEGRKIATIEGVAGCALWLLSDLGKSTTGEVVHVDAGFHMMGMAADEGAD